MEPCTLLETCDWRINLMVILGWVLVCIPGMVYLRIKYVNWKTWKEIKNEPIEL